MEHHTGYCERETPAWNCLAAGPGKKDEPVTVKAGDTRIVAANMPEPRSAWKLPDHAGERYPGNRIKKIQDRDHVSFPIRIQIIKFSNHQILLVYV